MCFLSLRLSHVLLLSVLVDAFAFTSLGDLSTMLSVERTGSSLSSDTALSLSLSDVANTLTTSEKSLFDRALIGEVPTIGLAAAAGLGLLTLSNAVLPPAKLLSPSSLQSILEGTYLEGQQRKVKCVYKASRDGWTALDFHQAVDGRGSGVVVGRTLTGTVFGGYNPAGWRSTDDYYSSTAAFLWCFRSGNIVKLPVLPGGDGAIYDYATGGPCFGSADLLIGPPQAAVLGGFAGPNMEDESLSAGNLRQCKSSVGSTYDWQNAWPVRGTAQLVDLEVYCKQ